MTRKELITSREYWVITIALAFKHTSLKHLSNKKRDLIAEDMVNEGFMSIINEIMELEND